MADTIEILASSLTDVGRVRSVNQDTLCVYEPADSDTLSLSGRLYIVADGAGGVGGALAGKIASRYATRKVQDLYYQSAGDKVSVGERLRTAMLAANTAIQTHTARPGRPQQMATTMVAAVIQDAKLTIANVGDSRAYLLRDNEIQQLTQDHSLVAGLVADGVITPEEATHHPQRNVILFSLGSAPYPPRIDLFSLTLKPGDVLVLCTDGLTRYADDEQLKTLVEHGPKEKAAHRLVDFANAAGGADNITVAVIHIKHPSLPRWVWWLLLLVGTGLIVLSGLAGLALTGWMLSGGR